MLKANSDTENQWFNLRHLCASAQIYCETLFPSQTSQMSNSYSDCLHSALANERKQQHLRVLALGKGTNSRKDRVLRHEQEIDRNCIEHSNDSHLPYSSNIFVKVYTYTKNKFHSYACTYPLINLQAKQNQTRNKAKTLLSIHTREIKVILIQHVTGKYISIAYEGHPRRGMLQPLTHASHRPPALRRSKEYCAKHVTRLNPCRVLEWSITTFHEWRESDLLAKKYAKWVTA